MTRQQWNDIGELTLDLFNLFIILMALLIPVLFVCMATDKAVERVNADKIINVN